MSGPDDFVDIMGTLTNFIQGQRNIAYNEAVDEMLSSVKQWVRLQGIESAGDYIPVVLNDFLEKYEARDRASRLEIVDIVDSDG